MLSPWGYLSLVSLLVVASWFDIRSRRIPNQLILLGILLGVMQNALGGSPGRFSFGFYGFLIGFGLMLLPYIFGWLGAGDVKLFAVVGLFLGPDNILDAAVYTAICGGVLAMLYIVITKVSKIRGISSNDPANKPTLPYGVAIFGGTLMALFFSAGEI
ncbi:prepilin peptidase [Polynucleobacter sp. MWH-Braz-FAM2G]|uniref:A24 family peptidase n=1 Tax=Polynucleobacter sp. MWH-Braz-FAM2G TaxID=1855883 RepID=UPI00203D106B|nr:prepilin peptidase [Polynucleobacter sp. MWH-Braz-FAM2G]